MIMDMHCMALKLRALKVARHLAKFCNTSIRQNCLALGCADAAAVAWFCLLYLDPACIGELWSPACAPSAQLNKRSQFFPNASTRRSCLLGGRPFDSTWNDLPFSLWSLPKTSSQTILSHLKMLLFGCTGVGRASEWSSFKGRYIYHRNEWICFYVT